MKIAINHPSALMGYSIPICLNNKNLLFKCFTDCYSSKNVQSIAKNIDNYTFSKYKLYNSVMKRNCFNLDDEKFIDLGFSGYWGNFLRSQK